MTVIWQSEIDPYASQVLAKHWPDIPNLGDITRINWNEMERPDVICGGYPCPAFSQAARGRNVAPDLWPHMRTALARLQPTWAVLENVAAHLHRGFTNVLHDLADLGFDARWDVVTACAVGAPHLRRRLFCIAHTNRHSQHRSPFHAETSSAPQMASMVWRWADPPHHLGMADGLPRRMDRLRALGNAVVPQVAEHIGRHILEADRCLT